MSACVARGTPSHCVSASWASSGRCPSTTVCGFPTVWVVCEGVRGGLLLVAGGWLVLVQGGCAFRVVCDGLRVGSPSSTSSSTSCFSRPVLDRRLCRVVCWVGSCWMRLVGWRVMCGRGVTLHQRECVLFIGTQFSILYTNIGSDVWVESSIMTGVYECWCSSTLHIGWGLCDSLCLVFLCGGRYSLGGGVPLFILGSSFGDDRPFIVLTETKTSNRHIPVWARYSPLQTRVEAHANTLSP
jgi:hypothetical protein